MAALCLASAEMSIAYVGKFDLNKNDDIINPELGFGNNAFRTINDNNLMSSINRIRQNVLSQKVTSSQLAIKQKRLECSLAVIKLCLMMNLVH